MSTFVALAAELIPRDLGGKVVVAHELVHEAGADRLVLRNIVGSVYWRLLLQGARESGHPDREISADRVADFHSLVWEKKVGNDWKTERQVSRRTFKKVARAWVTGLHRFDPATGLAVIQIAQVHEVAAADLPHVVQAEATRHTRDLKGQKASEARYSWVSWQMRTNTLVEVVKQCAWPFERCDDA